MAKSLRVDDVVISGDAVSVALTYGTPPLPPPPGSESTSFGSQADIAALADELEGSESVKNLMIMLRIATAYRVDPTFGPAFVAAAKGSVTVNLALAPAPITVS